MSDARALSRERLQVSCGAPSREVQPIDVSTGLQWSHLQPDRSMVGLLSQANLRIVTIGIVLRRHTARTVVGNNATCGMDGIEANAMILC